MKIKTDILFSCSNNLCIALGRKIICTFLYIVIGKNLFAQADPENKIKYQLEPNGISFSIKKNWDNSRKLLRMQHSDEMDMVLYDTCFNRGIKRGRIILATGDKPRFALLYSALQSKLDPDLVKMGDGRFRITIGDDLFWLDELHPEKVIFNPSSTEYLFEAAKYPGLKMDLTISQMLDRGAIARFRIYNNTGNKIEFKVECIYGGLRTCNRTFSASYFKTSEKENLQSNQLLLSIDSVQLSDSVLPGIVSFKSLPAAGPVVQGKKAIIPLAQIIVPGTQTSLYYFAELSFGHEPVSHLFEKKDAEKIIGESSGYYDSLLSQYEVQTPDTILNSAFKTALINFDYLYADKAWLEGIHWWSAYWTNNFQIGAAISLGQMERARKALAFFSASSLGPCPILKADGNPDAQSKNGEDGLPYFINNLIRYYQFTGDTATIIRILPSLRYSIEELWKRRDQDGNGLINWHMGANAFMYQADHLEMPGDAASPSMMMAGMLDRLSRIAYQIGRKEDAVKWEALSLETEKNLREILWNKTQGAFYNHRDEQGLLHTAHYYSDLVFPCLYSGLPDIYIWQSLDYLSRSLWMNNYHADRTLMRVGEFKPSIFGNDNVMPAQMSEAARAYFKTGDNESGIKLLDAVSLAGTVFTEAPGNFPERMNDEGKGEANYLFGNPVGSFLDAFISGLFGLQIKEENNTLSCEPAFPGTWNRASLKLPYASVNFRKIKEKQKTLLTYDIVQNKNRKTDFSISPGPCREVQITCNDQTVNFKVLPGLQTTRIHFEIAKAPKLHIVIKYTAVAIPPPEEVHIFAGQALDWESPMGIYSISDPQQTFYSNSIAGNHLHAIAGTDTGSHAVYIQLSEIPVIVRLKIHIQSPNAVIHPAVIVRANLKNDPAHSLDMSPLFNTNRIYLTSRWRNEYALRDSSYFASIPDSSKSILKAYGYTIRQGYSMAMICKGISDPFTTKTISDLLPDSLSFQIHSKLKALSFLWVCETQARNTGMNVGTIRLKYIDGSETVTSLIVGENLDASWKYFASASEPVFMNGEDYAKTYTISCDPAKELGSFSVRLTAADVQIGLLGVSKILP